MDNEIKKTEELLINIALKIAKKSQGCLLCIELNKIEYEKLLEQDIKPFNIFENQRRLELLAIQDGACIIAPDGKCIAYSVKIMNTEPYRGYGTRHAAAYSASKNGNIVIMSSEEDMKVRIFKNGQLVMQLDPLQKNIEYNVKEAVSFLESLGVGSIAAIGTSLVLPTAGIMIVPGIIIFGSFHYILKLLGVKNKIIKMLKENKK